MIVSTVDTHFFPVKGHTEWLSHTTEGKPLYWGKCSKFGKSATNAAIKLKLVWLYIHNMTFISYIHAYMD